jgi:hypothetical protein
VVPRVKDQDKLNFDLAYMASFWWENQLVEKEKKKTHGLENQSVS